MLIQKGRVARERESDVSGNGDGEGLFSFGYNPAPLWKQSRLFHANKHIKWMAAKYSLMGESSGGEGVVCMCKAAWEEKKSTGNCSQWFKTTVTHT